MNRLNRYASLGWDCTRFTTPIGTGGMGQVYKARGTLLDRTVAIKVSTANSMRFEREARAVTALGEIAS